MYILLLSVHFLLHSVTKLKKLKTKKTPSKFLHSTLKRKYKDGLDSPGPSNQEKETTKRMCEILLIQINYLYCALIYYVYVVIAFRFKIAGFIIKIQKGRNCS